MPVRAFAAFVVFAGVCLAQTSTTQLSGTVADNSGAVLPAAVVTVVNESTGAAMKQLTNSAGLFAFPAMIVGAYTVSVEMQGFKTARLTNVTLAVGTPLTENITLELGDTHDVVKVEASIESLNTSNATLGNVIEKQAIARLPLNGRNPLNLVVLEPGVTQRSGTTINVNGLRAQAGNVTIDGIEANEASNPTPTNNVFRINPDNVEEFKATTSNPTPEEGKNSGLNISIATRSGTNAFHISGIEYFRNTDLNSNEFYANAQGQKRADLKSNQYGYDAGGPIRKNKTFFYTAWQGQKVNLSQAIDKAFGKVPNVYTASALSGVYRYFVSDPANPLSIGGSKVTANSKNLVTATGDLAPGIRNCASPTDLNCVQSYNMFANDPQHIGGDPSVLSLLRNYPAANNYQVGDGLNTAGYLWSTPSGVRGPRNLLRIDHSINDKNNVFFRAMWALEEQTSDLLNGRPAIFPGFPPRGAVERPAKNYALSWRTVISPAVVNEFTLGYARFKFLFTYGDSNPKFPGLPAYTFNNVDVDYINSPHTARTLNTPQLLDNVSWTRGAHQLKFGTNMRFYQQNNQLGTVAGQTVTPSISLSASLNPPGTAFNLPAISNGATPGIAGTDSTRLQATVNDLLGIPATLKQAFLGNLNTNSFLSNRSGNYFSLYDVGERLKQFNYFAQDEWRVRRNVTMTYGVRWEINLPATETSESPYVPNRPIDGSAGPVTFVKADSWYQRKNLNAIAPRIGLTWSPGSKGKTVVRAGWGMAFDPIATYVAAAAANSVPGLAYTCTATAYGSASATPGCQTVSSAARISTGFPQALATPSNSPSVGLSPTPQLYGVAPPAVIIDPDLKMATVHQWNLTVQHELPGGFVLQAAYVANRGERLYSQLDKNQISAAPVLPSFNAMETNLHNGCKPDGSGCPAGITGAAVPYVTGGILTSAFVNSASSITDLQQNAAGNFAGRIEQTTLAAHLRPNQQFSSIIFVGNSADSVYHSLQTTLRKRFGNGLLLNMAYTFGKVIDDQSGDPVGTSYTPTTSTAIDSTNLRLDRGVADFNQKHVFSTTWIYELPFGKGKPFLNSAPGIVDTLFGGWSIQGFNSLMSGEPFSISSGAKTSNFSINSRAALVTTAVPDASLKPGSTGPVYFTDASAFSVPAIGSTGIGRNTFRGPIFWDMDGAVSKSFQPMEKLRVTLRMEAFNALNHANFRKLGSTSTGSTNILSTSFGTACCQTQSTSTSTAIVSNGEAYRVVQFVLKMSF